MMLESPTGVATRLPPVRLAVDSPVSLDTSATIRGEVSAPEKLDTKFLVPFAPLYWLPLVDDPISAGAAIVAVAPYIRGCRSTSAATPPAASTGMRTRIHSRFQMIRR